jgi:hypothetical protein
MLAQRIVESDDPDNLEVDYAELARTAILRDDESEQ